MLKREINCKRKFGRNASERFLMILLVSNCNNTFNKNLMQDSYNMGHESTLFKDKN